MRYLLMVTLTAICGFGQTCLAASSDFPDFPQKVDSDEARHLAGMGYNDDSYFKYMEPEGPEFEPKFFGFTGLGDTSIFGMFAVNPWTGDVWDIWDCKRLSTPELRRKQADIRLRFSSDEAKQYARLRRLKPVCTND